MSKLLVIEDNPGIVTALEVLFSLYDIETIHAHSPELGLAALSSEEIDLVIQDMNFTEDTTSGEEGRLLFNDIHQRYPELPVILLTAWGDIEMAVQLVKAGASDYLTKPWDDTKLVTTVKNLLELAQLRQQTQEIWTQKNQQKNGLINKFDLCGTVFNSQSMIQCLTMVTQIAHADIPVLITGPNGSGKEKIAEIIQANSNVKDKPFVKVNVGALPIDLLEAELFGAEAGAFTGANKTRVGRFELADGGTLFLDEIGNLPLSGQVKLLRAIQTGEFERLGSSETRKVNVRIISATNANLLEEIKQNNFREDLYYRLNVIEVNVAPLAERVDDILPLALHFMTQEYSLSPDAEHALQQYSWPGNVRELENVVRRACLLAKNNCITKEALGLTIEPKARKRERAELPNKELLQDILIENKYNISQTAKQLGLSRQSLYRRMEKLNIQKKWT